MKRLLLLFCVFSATLSVMQSDAAPSFSPKDKPIGSSYTKRFSHRSAYWKYLTIEKEKGADSANAFYMKQLFMPDPFTDPWLLLSGGNLTGLLDIYVSSVGSGLRIGAPATGTSNDAGIDFYAANGANVPTYARIGLGVSSGSVGSESGYLVFSTKNSGTLGERMRVTKEGFVGVGTITPTVEMDIAHASAGSGLRVGGVATGTANDAGIDMYVTNGTSKPTYARISLGVNTASIGSESGYLTMSTINSGSFTEKMRITKEGNVGIGTTSPDSKLEIIAPNAGAGNGNEGIRVSATGTYDAIDIGMNGASHYGWIRVLQQGIGEKDLSLQPLGGNVGIGTTSPSEKLYVEGNISANGVVKSKKIWVTQLGWFDYVFDKKYKLRSLSSLENFIKQNKHLPDMPSAKEVEEKGISVGDNQALLLKKIEELTLYVIELQKQINVLKNKN